MNRVLILEDIQQTRRWLAEVVGAVFPGASIVEAASVRMGLSLAHAPFDLALIDLQLPDGQGLDVLRAVRSANTHVQCVVTTVFGDDANVMAALAAGADGFLVKDQITQSFARQLQQLADGVPALSPSIARRIMEHFRKTAPEVEASAELTAREKQVLGLIGSGLRNSEVARELRISEHTVAGYVKSVYRKLGIASRAEAAWHAARFGLSYK